MANRGCLNKVSSADYQKHYYIFASRFFRRLVSFLFRFLLIQKMKGNVIRQKIVF